MMGPVGYGVLGGGMGPQPGAMARYSQGLDSWTPFGQAGIGGMGGYVGQIRGNMPQNFGPRVETGPGASQRRPDGSYGPPQGYYIQDLVNRPGGGQKHYQPGPNPFSTTPNEQRGGPLNPRELNNQGVLGNEGAMQPPSPREIKQLQSSLSDPETKSTMAQMAKQAGAPQEVTSFLEGGGAVPPNALPSLMLIMAAVGSTGRVPHRNTQMGVGGGPFSTGGGRGPGVPSRGGRGVTRPGRGPRTRSGRDANNPSQLTQVMDQVVGNPYGLWKDMPLPAKVGVGFLGGAALTKGVGMAFNAAADWLRSKFVELGTASQNASQSNNR